MASITREAREGLMRAWLEILRERHPDMTWVPAEQAVSEGESPTDKRAAARPAESVHTRPVSKAVATAAA